MHIIQIGWWWKNHNLSLPWKWLQRCLWPFRSKAGPARAASPSTHIWWRQRHKQSPQLCVKTCRIVWEKWKSNILQPMKDKFIKSLSSSFIQPGRIFSCIAKVHVSSGQLATSQKVLGKSRPHAALDFLSPRASPLVRRAVVPRPREEFLREKKRRENEIKKNETHLRRKQATDFEH